jgi:hypothetical protein
MQLAFDGQVVRLDESDLRAALIQSMGDEWERPDSHPDATASEVDIIMSIYERVCTHRSDKAVESLRTPASAPEVSVLLGLPTHAERVEKNLP